jgi:hypothetical protein
MMLKAIGAITIEEAKKKTNYSNPKTVVNVENVTEIKKNYSTRLKSMYLTIREIRESTRFNLEQHLTKT